MELNDTSFFYWLYYYLNYYEMMKNWKLLWQVIFGDSAKTKQRGSLSLTTPHACKMMSLLYILFHRTCSSIVEPEAWPQIMEYGMLFMWHTTYVSETEITVLQKLYYHYSSIINQASLYRPCYVVLCIILCLWREQHLDLMASLIFMVDCKLRTGFFKNNIPVMFSTIAHHQKYTSVTTRAK